MGHTKTTAAKATRATLGAFLIALLLCAFASPALAAPTHPRKEALDITGLNHACGIATDSKGDLYASSAGTSEVKVYDPSHNLLTQISDAHEPCGLAVTTTGVLYVSEKATGEVVRFKPNAYPFAGTPTYGPREVIDASTKAKGIAVDRFDDALYVAEGDRVSAYNAEGALGINEVQRARVLEATGGFFKLIFGGEETVKIAWNANHKEVQEALEALTSIGKGNVSVTQGLSSSETDHRVTFIGALGATDVESLTANTSELTGGGSNKLKLETIAMGFSGHIGEGTLTEATGVAAFTYSRSGGEKTDRYLWAADAKGLLPDRLNLFAGQDPRFLKPRRELTGTTTPDGSFGFGASGAYLAADPGNRDTEGKCILVGEQACTAGHLFLYDAAHGALDEFDGSGEYLDQTKNAAFADASPTAIAIERSGAAGDGTIYVTAGAGPGAKALAFGPLAPPSRAVLPEPISRLLPGAPAVATDSNGYVYVPQATLLHVYKPNGAEIKTEAGKALIQDPGRPGDVAIDSAGNVYVMDVGKAFIEEYLVTYYTPSSYPPDSKTTYTRHEPPIATYKDFSNSSLEAIAVNPGPGPGKDHLFVTSAGFTHEYDSAAHESKLLDPDFAKAFKESGRRGIAVNGANGNVYIGENPSLISVVDPAGTELLARFQNTAANGKTGSNPRLAVDQSNGHVIQFDGATSTAREYDAAGSFVAQFGTFTEGLVKDYRVAVDSACTLHEPKLSGKACEEFDPANGTAYVAFDDTNLSHPPYDVSAFGVLSYPETGEPPVAVTGIADEFGPGAATLNGTVDPNGTLLEECRFEYLTEAEYQNNGETFAGDEEEACAESPAEIGTGTKPVPVHADLEGLAETPYRFRLVASNTGGSSEGEAVLFGPPQIEALSPLPVLYHEATLRAKVNPSGLASEYRFDFVDAQSFEEQGGFEGPATRHSAWTELVAGEAMVQVSAAIVGLTEGTEYRYRAVAKNDDATTKEPTQSFTTQIRRAAEECANGAYRFGLSANLPDCRAYELVTPAQTNGLTPEAVESATSPSGGFSDWLTAQRGEGAGEDLTYFTNGTLPGFEGNGVLDGYRAERGAGDHPAGGWQSQLFSPDYAESAPGIFHSAYQLGVAPDQLYSAWELNPEPETFPETLPHGVYLRTPAGFEVLGQGSLGEDLEALSRYVSAGGAHAIFASKEHLEEGAAPKGTEALYDRAAGATSAEVISVKPDGSAFDTGESATYIGASEDGAAVAFKVDGTLYLHREGETTEIAEAPATFAGVSEDGTRVFSHAKGGFPAALYVCDTEAGPCAGEGAHPPTEIATSGIFALISPDGSHAFFDSTEVLTGSEENDNGEDAEAGQRNLYSWDGAETRFVGKLAAFDYEAGAFGTPPASNLTAWTGATSALAPTRSTPGGGVLVFQSHARLTSYDNEGVGEIYRYEPSAEEGERLLCVSCDPSGAAPSANALLEDIRFHSGTPLKSSTRIANLTDDGQEVFFQSLDRLLPEDANEVEDVYEWRAKGSGTPECTRPGGCLALISSGQGEVPSFLYAMSADGSDVFIHTKEKLVGMDEAGSPSVYDAREGGGIPEPAVPAPCQGDACQGNGTVPPSIPSSATTGTGEEATAPPASRCAKGKHRVKGRCVATKKHKHKRRHRRAHANRGGNR